jgi:hypothetical protein
MGASLYHNVWVEPSLHTVACFLRRMWARERGRNRRLEEIYNLFSQLNTSVLKRKTRWVRHIAGMGEMRNISLRVRRHLKELGTDGGITFKWNLNGLGCGLYSLFGFCQPAGPVRGGSDVWACFPSKVCTQIHSRHHIRHHRLPDLHRL